jgi:hypothetical protein
MDLKKKKKELHIETLSVVGVCVFFLRRQRIKNKKKEDYTQREREERQTQIHLSTVRAAADTHTSSLYSHLMSVDYHL